MSESKNVTLTDLAAIAAEKHGISKKQAEEILKDTFAEIKGSVKAGKQVDVFRFGSFKKVERAARTGRNPQTGETMQIAASAIPAFKASKAWKDELK